MAHSLENFTTIDDVLDVYEPMAVRLFLLQTHYRSSILYTRDALDNAVKALDRLRGALEGFDPTARRVWSPGAGRRRRVRASSAPWTTTSTRPAPSAALFDLVREINRRRAVRRAQPTRSPMARRCSRSLAARPRLAA